MPYNRAFARKYLSFPNEKRRLCRRFSLSYSSYSQRAWGLVFQRFLFLHSLRSSEAAAQTVTRIYERIVARRRIAVARNERNARCQHNCYYDNNPFLFHSFFSLRCHSTFYALIVTPRALIQLKNYNKTTLHFQYQTDTISRDTLKMSVNNIFFLKTFDKQKSK